MPLLKNAQKALRSSKRKAAVNNRVKSQMRTAIAAARTAPSAETIATAYSTIDLATKQNILHTNKAARLKRQVSALSAPQK